MRTTPAKLARTLLTSAVALMAAGAVSAGGITLRDIDGRTSISGELISYDGATYVLRTTLGDLTLNASNSICEGAECPGLNAETTNLFIAGSGTVTNTLIPQLAEAYFGDISTKLTRVEDGTGATYLEINGMEKGNLLMTLRHSNSGMGFAELVKGDLHAAFTTRPASVAERMAADDAGLGELRSETQESVIAHDALLLVTHPDNPVRAITETDIAKIYSEEVTDWADFGGTPGPINVYLREGESNSRALLEQVLMAPHRKDLAPNLMVLDSDAAIAEAVRADPGAIGLTSFMHRAGVNALEIEGVCGIRVPPTEFTIKTGEYPLARPVYFYHNQAIAHDGVTGFAEFLSSPEAQPHIREAGLVDRTILAKPLNEQGLRVSHAIMRDEAFENASGTQNMLRLMSRSERLSTTIRFDNGSTELDSSDYEALEDLAAMMQSPEYEGSDFYFLGFSDSIGRADLNQFVALQRAEIVRQALVSRYPELAARIKAKSVGYGELSPLACNETRPGRSVNRRVEVWVQNPMAALASR